MNRTRTGHRALALVALLVFWAGNASAGNAPSSEVKRQLFPVREALETDNLKLAETEAQKALALDPEVTETRLLLGEIYWRLGNTGKAKVEFEKARALGGGEGAALAGLALVALSSDDVAAAEAAANAAAAADKNLWLANYATGRVLLAKGQAEPAYKSFEKGKSLKGRADGRDLFDAGMGLLALAEKDLPSAETSFIKARAIAPNTVEHTMNLASFYEASNQWSQAATVLQASEAQVGSSPMLSYRVGRALERQQQWNDALRQYQKALQADSTFAPALAAVGHLYLLDRSKTQAAVDVLTRALAAQPLPAVRLDLATALVRAGKPADAVPHVEVLLQSDPSIATKIVAARVYIAADMLDKGLLLYQDVDVALEAPANDLVLLGNALTKAKQYDDARGWYAKALEKDETLHEVYYRLGFLDLVAKNYDTAITNFQKKLELDPKHAPSMMNLGVALQQQKKNVEAMSWFRKATQSAPNSAGAWTKLGQALSTDSTAAAHKAFDRALVIDANSAEAKRSKAFLYLVAEQYAPAIKLLREANATDPDDPMGWVWLGQALLNSGNHAEARTAYQQALKLDPGNKDAQDGLQLLNDAASSR